RSAWVSQDEIEFCPDGFFQKLRHVVTRGAGSRGAALWRCRGRAHVLYRLIRRIGAHINKMIRTVGTAEPSELSPVELDFFAASELIEIKRWVDRCDG